MCLSVHVTFWSRVTCCLKQTGLNARSLVHHEMTVISPRVCHVVQLHLLSVRQGIMAMLRTDAELQPVLAASSPNMLLHALAMIPRLLLLLLLGRVHW